MHKQKNIACLFLFIIFSIPVLSQKAVDLRSIKKQIRKTDKQLAAEFDAVKFIPEKTFIIQEYEGRDSLSFYLPERISVDGFYISAYEVTNKQYRQFMEYAQDSILRKLMGYVKQGEDGNEYNDLSKKFDVEKALRTLGRSDHSPSTPMFIEMNGTLWLKPQYLKYHIISGKKRTEIPVMPDTECWKRDYPVSYNEPLSSNYFSHPAFDDYPVIGVNFLQAQAYCHWKTKQVKNALGNNEEFDITISLPTATQWEAAAVFGTAPDPDSTEHSRQIVAENINRRYLNKPVKPNAKNAIEFDCNFSGIMDANGYTVKNPGDDGAVFTMKINAYEPNANGLYNMRGNVAEWTVTNGEECYGELKKHLSRESGSRNYFTDSIRTANPKALILTGSIDRFLDQMKETKIVKGGGWTSSPFYIQPGVNQFYNPSTQHGAIGFRYVVLFRPKTK